MYKCLDCGYVFDQAQMKHWIEGSGEPMSGCPECWGGFEEMRHCKRCGAASELILCKECIDDCANDLDLCMEIGKECKVEIDLNGFLYELYSEEEIEHILLNHAKENGHVCKDFILSDIDWFARHLN